MTQQQNDSAAGEGQAADEPNRSGDAPGPDSAAEPNAFTLAGPGSDPAAPAVKPAPGAAEEFGVGAESGTTPVVAQSNSTDAAVIGGAPTRAPSGDYDKYGVPTMDFVRDKIEARYAASLGAEELARQTEEAKSFEQRAEERAKAAEAALEAIRQSLRDHRQS